jgi:WD40 repeat protein
VITDKIQDFTDHGEIAVLFFFNAYTQGIKRTSNLQAPIMQLTGHGAEIYSLKFSPDGQALASGSFDRHIFLWKTYEDCPNYMMLKVMNSIHDMRSDEEQLSVLGTYLRCKPLPVLTA